MPRDVRDQCAGFRARPRLPFSRQVIGAVVTQLFWLCMKAVLSFIAKGVVAKGLDHDTFVLSIREIKPKKLYTEPVRSQLRGDFLLRRGASMGVYEYSIRTYSVPFFSRNRMIDSPSRFEDDAWTVIWLFPGNELHMCGDRFSIFGEFRSVCKILDEHRKYLSSLEDAVLSLLSFACSFPLPLLVRQVIGAVVAQLFWLCMKAVLSFIAKDVVAKGLDHDTFVLSIREIKPKKLDTEPVRGQLRGDFLLGRDQAE
ncbi:hypothetical protein DY000_02049979 [Brassica cretica]|uniref:Uncharacterized protein n=1 Tax=Brassica cretica TaxID=69181 RepID=A0ABQ7EZ54_BRACR|nr:hypothetical protein DY000_02049979 [Brassica cretica]